MNKKDIDSLRSYQKPSVCHSLAETCYFVFRLCQKTFGINGKCQDTMY